MQFQRLNKEYKIPEKWLSEFQSCVFPLTLHNNVSITKADRKTYNLKQDVLKHDMNILLSSCSSVKKVLFGTYRWIIHVQFWVNFTFLCFNFRMSTFSLPLIDFVVY